MCIHGNQTLFLLLNAPPRIGRTNRLSTECEGNGCFEENSTQFGGVSQLLLALGGLVTGLPLIAGAVSKKKDKVRLVKSSVSFGFLVDDLQLQSLQRSLSSLSLSLLAKLHLLPLGQKLTNLRQNKGP
jgi:hypothetical protein